MKEYRYCIVECWGEEEALGPVEEISDTSKIEFIDTVEVEWVMNVDELNNLLAQGWLPVRESPMGVGGQSAGAFSLVLLERDIQPS